MTTKNSRFLARGAVSAFAMVSTAATAFAADVTQIVSNSAKIESGGIVVSSSLGFAASAAVSATGAVASVGGNVINTASPGLISIAANGVQQLAVNDGRIEVGPSAIFITGSLGDSASASISSRGSVASTSVTVLKSGTIDPIIVSVGDVSQMAINSNSVTTALSLIQGGKLSGVNSSVAISSTGAAASLNVSLANIQVASLVATGSINQIAINTGRVTNTGSIQVASLTGTGSSASISATGAVASTSIAAATANNIAAPGPITQDVTNTGAISNAGVIAVGRLSGVGSSASISATGAAAVVSFGTIR